MSLNETHPYYRRVSVIVVTVGMKTGKEFINCYAGHLSIDADDCWSVLWNISDIARLNLLLVGYGVSS